MKNSVLLVVLILKLFLEESYSQILLFHPQKNI